MRLVFVYSVIVAVHSADIDWWKTAVLYQIYPRSFKDSNGDGIGDLNGITENLQFFKETGIDAIWLSPFFLSSMYDFGYDITDYRKIAPEYGTMEDFKNLLKRAKILGLRVLLDFVPNHTSNESDWFQKSEKREPGYEDYYVWADGVIDNRTGQLKPPNNWISSFGGSAWEYSHVRKQYYLHQFLIAQPDLNYRCYKIHEEMKDVMRFWLNMGVSGFRVDAINRLYEANPDNYGGVYPDEPRSGKPGATPDDYDYYHHIYTWDLDETYQVVFNWRDFLDEFTETQGEYKLMVTEGYTDLPNIIRYYGTKTRNGSIPFNIRFIEDKNGNSTAIHLKKIIDRWMNFMPEGETANWINGNHDEPRLASRVGVDLVDAMNMLVLILPGIAIIYQGEEIGMTNGYVSWQDTKDPRACNTHDPIDYYKVSRDGYRTPYHWDNSTSAGFSTNETTWLPVADNYKILNLAEQINNCTSHYHFFKDVIAARKMPALQYGDFETRALSKSVLVVTRRLQGAPVVLGIINLEAEEQFVDLSSMKYIYNSLKVIVAGINCPITKGTLLLKNNIPLPSFCSLLLESVQNCS